MVFDLTGLPGSNMYSNYSNPKDYDTTLHKNLIFEFLYPAFWEFTP